MQHTFKVYQLHLFTGQASGTSSAVSPGSILHSIHRYEGYAVEHCCSKGRVYFTSCGGGGGGVKGVSYAIGLQKGYQDNVAGNWKPMAVSLDLG